jgi:hypothetical protein
MSDLNLLEITNRITPECTDIRALMLSWAENQSQMHDCARQLFLDSFYCCGLTRRAELTFEESDTTSNFPVNLLSLDDAATFIPVFNADAEGNSQIQSQIDEQKYSSCINSIDTDISVDIQIPDYRPVEDQAMSETVDVELVLVFNLFCYDGSVQTISVPQDVTLTLGQVNSIDLEDVAIPFLYERGECNLDNIRLSYSPLTSIRRTSLAFGPEVIDAEVLSVLLNNARFNSVCFQDESCFLSLLTMIPKTGDCADPRLFFLGYQHNQNIIKNLIDKTQVNYAICCDDSFGQVFQFCDSKTDIEGIDPFVFMLEDENGVSLQQLLSDNDVPSCDLVLQHESTVCIRGGRNIDFNDLPYSAEFSGTIQLYSGNTILDSQDVTYTVNFSGHEAVEIQCFTQTITFETGINTNTNTLSQLYFVAGGFTFDGYVPNPDNPDNLNPSMQPTIDSYTTNSVCGTATCFPEL